MEAALTHETFHFLIDRIARSPLSTPADLPGYPGRDLLEDARFQKLAAEFLDGRRLPSQKTELLYWIEKTMRTPDDSRTFVPELQRAIKQAVPMAEDDSLTRAFAPILKRPHCDTGPLAPR